MILGLSLGLGAAVGCDAGAGNPLTDCTFTLSTNEVSPAMPTVGVIEWSVAGTAPSSARVVFRLAGAGDGVLNRGGEAPVDLGAPAHRTLLLGLKQRSDYTFHIEATRDGRTCTSPEYTLPVTGTLADAPVVGATVSQPDKRAAGFIVTSSGTSLPNAAFIIDADGDVVWYREGPTNTTRALMDYEGQNVWMIGLNLANEGGEMRSVSMDGQQESRDVAGLADAHHDFTVLPGGKVAALVWHAPGIDPPSDLVVRSPDGGVTTLFTIGANLYGSDAYHANAVHYVPSDDAFTIADRDPNVLVEVGATGMPRWQLGGTCDGAPSGPRCAPQDWQVLHGHHLLADGTLLVFANSITTDATGAAHVVELAVKTGAVNSGDATAAPFAATAVHDYTSAAASNNLGDVQRLPGGNTLVTYSSDGELVELDADWNEVQSFSVRTGYASWRPTLYGPPPRP